ncbi:hypothetical protein NP493_583g01064 [Ridgeia piscesae]|uniref:Coiled-coil domain-containing protein 178 n=1 Tax=Ridgeia piscesae TaxID=27915 RepID=A0AAD9NR51_RIDPI|nr:hypothetical protein NP493_583g01064 [Ridgeia piscesae]
MTALLDRDYKGDGIGTGNVVQFKDVAVYMSGDAGDDEIDPFDSGVIVSTNPADDSGIDDVLSEAEELPLALPEGWPNIPQLLQRHSWDTSQTISPSVRQAVAHLELLQDIIEDWYAESEQRIASRITSGKAGSIKSHGSEGLGTSPRCREMRFIGSASQSIRGALSSATSRHTSATSHRPETQLSVYGVGGITDTVVASKPPMEGLQIDLPYLGADDVIEEVVVILAKLEKDRMETRSSLQKERDRGKKLRSKIDTLAQDRLINLPKAVQKEHEACAMDISELKWTVSYRGRYEARFKEKVEVAEALNQKLEEDIDFVKKHVPLVAEKLELERGAMDRIKRAQEDTAEELDTTVQRCKSVVVKHGEAHVKADTERVTIKNDLEVVNTELNTIHEELETEKATHEAYVEQVDTYQKNLEESEQELKVLLVREENCRVAEELQRTKVVHLQKQVADKKEIQKQLEHENFKLCAEREMKKKGFLKEEKDLLRTLDEKEDKLKRTTISNKEIDMIISDTYAAIEKSKAQTKANQRNVDRIAKEQKNTWSQVELTSLELNAQKEANTEMSTRLSDEEERCLMMEQKIRALAEALTSQVKEEIHHRSVIASHISAQSSEYASTIHDLRAMSDKADKKAKEVDQAVQIVSEKVEKLRSIHKKITENIESLQTELVELDRAEKKMLEETSKEKKQLLPNHANAKAVLGDLDRKLQDMAQLVDQMCKKMDDMASETTVMNRKIHNSEKAIKEIEHEIEERKIQHKNKEELSISLKDSLKQIKDRIIDHDIEQKEHIKVRKEVLEQHKVDLEKCLSFNTDVAAKYRQLQNEFIALKNKHLDKLDARIQVEHAIADLKKLNCLQKKLHFALQLYYKYRGEYNEGEVARMEQESHANTAKVGELQGTMDGQLELIADFLLNQMDGNTIRQMAMAKVMKEEETEARKQGAAP